MWLDPEGRQPNTKFCDEGMREVSTFYISFVNQINPDNNYWQRFQMFKIFINNFF